MLTCGNTVAAGLQISGAAIITFLFESYPDNVLDVFRFYLVVANVSSCRLRGRSHL